MTDAIDTGEILEALNDKADRDLNNTSPLADYVIETQLPTAENSYTWYRLYKSGWVEQGGVYKLTSNNYTSFNLVKEMHDGNYTLVATFNDKTVENTSVYAIETGGYTTTKFYAKSTTNNANSYMCWEVKGVSAS